MLFCLIVFLFVSQLVGVVVPAETRAGGGGRYANLHGTEWAVFTLQ